MENLKTRIKCVICSLTLMLILILTSSVKAQEFANINLEIELSEALSSSQRLNFNSLGIDSKGRGAVIVSMFIENLSDQPAQNLFLQFNLSSQKIGPIFEYVQTSGSGFSLQPLQSVYATNNNFDQGSIPGISQKLSFDGGLTPQGNDFLENLNNINELPSDVYEVSVSIFQISNALGKQVLASSTDTFGSNNFEEIGNDIFLKAPGDVLGSGAEITNPFPQLSWEGGINSEYRVIVVSSDENNSPESLIQSARSSSPTNLSGSLLQFENLDRVVVGNTLQFPSSGAQALIPGKTYYWQVFEQDRNSDEILTSSEIWSFELVSTSRNANSVSFSEDEIQALRLLIEQGRFEELTRNGFSLESISADGRVIQGAAMKVYLSELLRKIEDEIIIIEKN